MTVRIALALLFIVPAAMAYPWESDIDWWVLGVAIAVVIVVFAWWRGLFVTTMIGRRLAVWRRNHPSRSRRRRATSLCCCASTIRRAWACRCRWWPATSSASASAARRCGSPAATRRAPHDVDRHDAGRRRQPGRAAGPFLGLPLHDTAEIVGRRLADHLRETGLDASIVDDAAGTARRPRPRDVARGQRRARVRVGLRNPGRRTPRRATRRGVVAAGGDLDRARIQWYLSASHGVRAYARSGPPRRRAARRVAGLTPASGHSAAAAHRVGSAASAVVSTSRAARCRRAAWSGVGWPVGAALAQSNMKSRMKRVIRRR